MIERKQKVGKGNRAMIVVGRAGVDLYADQADTDLRAVTSFHRYVGGSAGNIAVQVSRLSGKSILLTRIADDPWGEYIKGYLGSQGVSIPTPPAPPGVKNSLAVTEIKAQSRVLFYRQNPADLHLSPEDIAEKSIAGSAGMILTGTALSRSPSRESVLLALFYAQQHGIPVIMDLDYRPGFDNLAEVFLYYQIAMEKSDILIGTEEEFSKTLDFLISRGRLKFKREEEIADFFLRRGGKTELVIIKRGERGATAYQVRGKGMKKTSGGIFPVKVKKNFGAGDAFAGTFCHYYLRDRNLSRGLKRAAAAAAIVVSQGTCTEAMPTEQVLLDFVKKNSYKTN